MSSEAQAPAVARIRRAERAAVAEELIGLDALRGVAAALVLVGHARHFVLNDYGAGPRSALEKAFYALTGLGHQAVIVFFVLSGFLISRSIVRTHDAGAWNWRSYLVNRLARLWAVLIPCLLLTLALDAAAMAMSHSEFYAGKLTFYASGPAALGADLSPPTLLGNALFLQTVIVPVYGSNGPLWSLANEFWYYIAFPLLFMIKPARLREGTLLASVPAALLAGTLVNSQILLLWPAWLAGYYSFRVSRWQVAARLKLPLGSRIILATLALTILLSVLASRAQAMPSDLALASAIALAVTVLAAVKRTNGVVAGASNWSAQISYSLYLSHFPLLAFLSAVWLHNGRTELGPGGVGIFAALCAVSVFVAQLSYQLFESRTPDLKRVLSSILEFRPLGRPWGA